VTADQRAGNVLLSGNLISGARHGAIRAMDHDRPIGDDLAVAGTVDPMLSRRLRLEGNMAG
jgi:hypothetical protein